MASESVPLATLLHMVTIKLSPSNYLIWRNQMLPTLRCDNLHTIVDGTDIEPPSTVISEGTQVPNSTHASWLKRHDRALCILLSSLTEETMVEVLGLTRAAAVWSTLEAAFCPSTQSRTHQLRDEIQFLKRGSSTVADFARKFNTILHQLAAIGDTVSEGDKVRWFLRGLGSQYRTFADVQLALPATPSLRDLNSRARDHEIRYNLLDSNESSGSSVAFYAGQGRGQSRQSAGRNPSRGQQGRGRNAQSNGGNGQQQSASSGQRNSGNWRNSNASSGNFDSGRRNFTPRCQICRGPHYATVCDDRYKGAPNQSANLSQMFDAQCNVSQASQSDWFVDTGAFAHMTPTPAALDDFTPYNEPANQGNSGKGQM